MLFFGGGANAADPGLLMVLVVESAVDALELPADLTELAVELPWECFFQVFFQLNESCKNCLATIFLGPLIRQGCSKEPSRNRTSKY